MEGILGRALESSIENSPGCYPGRTSESRGDVDGMSGLNSPHPVKKVRHRMEPSLIPVDIF